MKIFNLYEFDDEDLESFTKFSNEYWEEPWLIYLECCGGVNWITNQMLYVLNLKSEMTKDVFINVSKAYSNGFELMMGFKGPVNILDGASGMIHHSTKMSNIMANGKTTNGIGSNYERILKKERTIQLNKDTKKYKSLMTEEEYKQYRDGYDIYFIDSQLRSFIKKRNFDN